MSSRDGGTRHDKTPFGMKEDADSIVKKMVGPAGFEPATS